MLARAKIDQAKTLNSLVGLTEGVSNAEHFNNLYTQNFIELMHEMFSH